MNQKQRVTLRMSPALVRELERLHESLRLRLSARRLKMLLALRSADATVASVARRAGVSESTVRRWYGRARKRLKDREALDRRDLEWIRSVLTQRGRGSRPRLEAPDHVGIKRRLARWARVAVSIEVRRRSAALLVILDGGTLAESARSATRSSGRATSVSTVHRWKTGLLAALESGETDAWLEELRCEVRTSSKKARAKRLRDEGWSTRRASRRVGLSQSTVVRLGKPGRS